MANKWLKKIAGIVRSSRSYASKALPLYDRFETLSVMDDDSFFCRWVMMSGKAIFVLLHVIESVKRSLNTDSESV